MDSWVRGLLEMGSRGHPDWERADQEEKAHLPRVLWVNKKYILVSALKSLVIPWEG